MNIKIWIWVFCFNLFVVSSSVAKPDYHPQRLIVKAKPDQMQSFVNAQAKHLGIQSFYSLSAHSKLARTNALLANNAKWHRLDFAKNSKIEALRDQLLASKQFEYVEYDYYRKLRALPNDANFVLQWGLHNIGGIGAIDADIDAVEAWDVVQPDSNIIVAVIDTGVDYNHVDLQNSMWINSGEIANNGLDDDGNGFVDDVNGYDFLRNIGDPMDNNIHGTHVAGIIAASANNTIGVAGVSWTSKIMPVVGLSATSGSDSTLVAAIEYAVDNGAKIINASWGGPLYSQALYDAVAYAQAAGVLFVAAAGNASANLDFIADYPANFDLANIITVAATNRSDGLAFFSNYGMRNVDVAAPGEDIYSTLPNSQYGYLSGTSMAAPLVSGAAALLASHDPSKSFLQLRQLLISSSDPIIGLQQASVSRGRVNLNSALNCNATQLQLSSANIVSGQELLFGEPQRFEVYAHSCGVAASSATVSLSIDQSAPLALFDDGTNGDVQAGDGLFSRDNIVWNNVGPSQLIVSATDSLLGAASQAIDVNVIREIRYTITEPNYQWQATDTATTASLFGDDQSTTTPIPIGFEFPFYGNIYSDAFVSTNGILSFGTGHTVYSNDSIPSGFQPNNAIYAHWDDLEMLPDSRVSYELTGLSPNQIFTVTWENAIYYRSITRLSFQVQLHENGDIVLNYQSLGGRNGGSATIGVENDSGTQASQYSFNNQILTDARSIKFSAYETPIAIPGGPFTALVNEDINFDASASSNPNGGVLSFQWNFGDQTSSTLINPIHAYLQRGVYEVSLIVNDGFVSSLPAITKAFIGPNNPPTISLPSTISATMGFEKIFSEIVIEDADADELSYQWDFGDGITSLEPMPAHAYLASGDYQLTLTVDDAYGEVSASALVQVLDPPQIQTGGPYASVPGTPIDFDASATSNPNNRLLEFFWDFGDGQTATGPQVTHVYASNGVYTVSLSVSDGLTETMTSNFIVIANNKPVINLLDSYVVAANATLDLSAVVVDDADGDELLFEWNFGDNNTSPNTKPIHSYANPGLYTLTLNVSDGIETVFATAEVIMAQVPVATISTDTVVGLPNEEISLSATSSEVFLGATISDVTWTQISGPELTLNNSKSETISLLLPDKMIQWLELSVGWQHSCAIRSDHTLWCWGANDAQQITNNLQNEIYNIPTQVNNQNQWRYVTVGEKHTCAIDIENLIHCWGDNSNQQLGSASWFSQNRKFWLAIDSGANHSCALNSDGEIWCWGDNQSSQLSDIETLTMSATPMKIAVPNSNWTSMSLGNNHSCGLNQDDQLYCWGENISGALGDGSYIDSGVPKLVSANAVDTQWSSVELGLHHSCAIRKTDRAVFCWGLNSDYQVNQNSQLNILSPFYWKNAAVGETLALGARSSCLIDQINGQRSCRGWGDFYTFSVFTEQSVALGTGPIRLQRATNKNMCLIDSQGVLFCVGDNVAGQLGLGDALINFSAIESKVGNNIQPISFKLSIADSYGGVAESDIVLGFNNRPEPIIMNNASLIYQEGDEIVLQAASSFDAEQSPLFYEWTVHNEVFHQVQMSYPLTNTPTLDAQLRVTDAAGLVSTTMKSFKINRRPQTLTDQMQTLEDQSISINVLDNDTDADFPEDILTLVSVSSSRIGNIIFQADGEIVFEPFAEVNGVDTLDYLIQDRYGLSQSGSISVSVSKVNDAPIPQGQNFISIEDSSLEANLSATDVDSTELTYHLDASTKFGTIELDQSSGQLQYIPNKDFQGTDYFRWHVSDAETSSQTITSVVIVENQNDAPVAEDDAFSFYAGSSFNLNAALNNDRDIDGDELSIIKFSQPSSGDISAEAIYQSDDLFEGVVVIDYTISDSEYESSASIILNITGMPQKVLTLESKTERASLHPIQLLLFLGLLAISRWRKRSIV